jgi:hypothetical protein
LFQFALLSQFSVISDFEGTGAGGRNFAGKKCRWRFPNFPVLSKVIKGEVPLLKKNLFSSVKMYPFSDKTSHMPTQAAVEISLEIFSDVTIAFDQAPDTAMEH